MSSAPGPPSGPTVEPTGAFPSPAGLGRPIHGPRAITGDWRRFAQLTFTIARNEFKLRFFGSALGYVWQLMRPLLLFGILYVVFTQVFNASKLARHFPVILLSGIVLFTFFAESTAGSVRSVVDREGFVRKIQFPRLVIPLSVVLTAFFNLCLNLVAVGIFVLAQGIRPEVSWLELPLILLLLVILTCGMSMLLSALFVPFRDVQPIWEVIVQILFYASPVLYPVERLTSLGGGLFGVPFARLYMINPLACVLQQFRHAIIDHSAPSAASAIGGWLELCAPLGLVAGIFALGFWVFNRSAPLIADAL